MASSIEKKLAKHLESPICLETFEKPKVLSCQHSYCEKCLEGLMTRVERKDNKVTCPECRMETKVPGGDVSRLPTNFLLNNLLSLYDDTQPGEKKVTCAKHDGETLKFFCQTCDQPICGDYTVIEHHGHRYLYIKDLFAAEKEKVLKILQESRETISALESSIARDDTQELKLQESALKVRECIDSFINTEIEILKAEGKHLKNELQKLISTQEEDFQAQKDSLCLSLGCLRSSVEFTEQALSRGDEAAVLTGKSQLSQKLKQSNARGEIKPLQTTFYILEIKASLDDTKVRKMAHIRKHDEEYKLSTHAGNFGHLEETYVEKLCYFVVSKEKCKFDFTKIASLPFHHIVQKATSPESNVPLIPPAQNSAQVRIKSPSSLQIHSSVIEGENDCSFFSYRPDEIGTYTIEIIINGRYIHGCPFDWIVKGIVASRQYRKMDDEFD